MSPVTRTIAAAALAISAAACSHQPTRTTVPAHVDAIDAYVRTEMAHYRIPGMAIAIVRDDKIVKTAAYGVAVIEHDVPVTAETLFQLDSTNKLLTAVATMILEREGKLRLDDPIARFLPDAPATWSGITVRHLLTHTSGIRDNYTEIFHGSLLVDYETTDLVSYALAQPLVHNPGEVSEYNNLGFFLLTQIVERASGLPYRRFMETRVLAPAGMTQSSYADRATIVRKLATSYAMRAGELVFLRDYMVSRAGESYALKSTVGDVARFHLALVSGRLIDAAALDRMRERSRLLDGTRGQYGMAFEEGLRRGWPFYGKGGRSGAMYVAYPAQHLAVVVLANLDDDTGHVPYLSIVNDIAGLADPALALSEPAHDDGKGAAFLELLRTIAGGQAVSHPVNPRWLSAQPPTAMKEAAAGLATIKELVPLGCDDSHVPDWESYGMTVARTCEYRIVANGPAPERFITEWARDGTLISVHTP